LAGIGIRIDPEKGIEGGGGREVVGGGGKKEKERRDWRG